MPSAEQTPRRVERERVLSLLYEAEMKDVGIEEVLRQLPVRPDEFIVETVTGVDAETADIDVAVDKHAIDWTTDRMASLDRSIIRIGAWELIHRPELPVAVIISEAVELAKRFSTEESGKFINGVLASLANEVRAQ